MAIFLFFGVMVIGPVIRRIFGNKFGSVLVGGATGLLAYLFTASLLLAGLAAVVALLLTLLSNSTKGGGRGGGGPLLAAAVLAVAAAEALAVEDFAPVAEAVLEAAVPPGGGKP